MKVFTKLPKYSYDKNVSDIKYDDIQIEDRGETVLKTVDCEFCDCYIDDSFEKSGFLLTDYPNVYKFTDGTYGVQDSVTGGYLPIDESQFKRSTIPYLFRYPEGKPDESYTVKGRYMNIFDENGNERTGYHWAFYSPSLRYSFAFKDVQFLKEIKFEEGIRIFYNRIESASIERISIPSSFVSMGDTTGIGREGYYGLFSGLTNLKEYKVDENNTVFKSVDGALLSKDGKILYSMPGKIGENYTVPDGVETIEASAFANAKNMTINIPASVKYLSPDPLSPIDAPTIFRNRGERLFNNSSDITLNVSSKTEIRDIFEKLPGYAEGYREYSGITVNFVD